MQSVVRMVVIFHNVITDRMPDFVRNKEVKRHYAMSVRIPSGHAWMLRKLLHIY